LLLFLSLSEEGIKEARETGPEATEMDLCGEACFQKRANISVWPIAICEGCRAGIPPIWGYYFFNAFFVRAFD